MNLLHWLTADHPPGTVRDLHWAWATVGLSAAVAVAYIVLAVNRYFQAKLDRRREATAAAACMRNVVLACCAFGYVFYATDMAWSMWRLYDLALLALALYAWASALRTRGIRLVDERLAQVGELERSAEKYRQMAEHLPDIVWTATADGCVDFCNQRWFEYAGAGRASWLDAVHPDERPQVLAWWSATVAAREPAEREVRLVGTAGARTFVVRAAPVVRGDAVRWLGACSDVEGQKVRAAEKEQQAKQKTFFLNALSHDLRAPLNIVALNAHLLKTSARDEADAESAKLIIENATAAGNLLARALELAKADAEDHNAAEAVSVAGVLRQVARGYQPACEAKGLTLRVTAEPDVQLVTDRLKVERVVTNLVDNAVKFTERGGVTVELFGSTGEGRATVRVRDTGPGVSPQDAGRLFDEFYQGGRAGVAGGGAGGAAGFGMGLAICRFLLRQIGGDVRLFETGPAGSCFEATFRNAGAPSTPTAGGGEHREFAAQSVASSGA